jgi:hypothetical protein
MVEKVGGPKAGDRYVLANGTDRTIEWVLVRYHPDGDETVLVVPMDDTTFLVGTADVPMEKYIAEPFVARCGCAQWLPPSTLRPDFRVGVVPAAALSAVRRALADLARGRLAGGGGDDDDPEYQHLIEDLLQAGNDVSAEAYRLGFEQAAKALPAMRQDASGPLWRFVGFDARLKLDLVALAVMAAGAAALATAPADLTLRWWHVGLMVLVGLAVVAYRVLGQARAARAWAEAGAQAAQNWETELVDVEPQRTVRRIVGEIRRDRGTS